MLKTYGSDVSGFKPSLTYRIVGEKIEGMCDGIDAVKQSLELLLSTERWRHFIYSGDYGTEFDDLFGKSIRYVEADIKRRITETLLQDDRVKNIDNITFTRKKDKMSILLKVTTILGELDIQKEVFLNA